MLVFAGLLLAGCTYFQKDSSNSTASNYSAITIPSSQAFPQACFENGECLQLEIASTPHQHEVGLMNRPVLDVGSGMLFVFEQTGKEAFWMKNTLIPLDIAWISEQKEIVDVQHMVPCKQEPCTIYQPKAVARYALEMNYGAAAANGLKEGQAISLKLIP